MFSHVKQFLNWRYEKGYLVYDVPFWHKIPVSFEGLERKPVLPKEKLREIVENAPEDIRPFFELLTKHSMRKNFLKAILEAIQGCGKERRRFLPRDDRGGGYSHSHRDLRKICNVVQKDGAEHSEQENREIPQNAKRGLHDAFWSTLWWWIFETDFVDFIGVDEAVAGVLESFLLVERRDQGGDARANVQNRIFLY